MSWFERQASGSSVAEFTNVQARFLRAAGVDRALDELSGPFGLRRYLVRFATHGAGVKVRAVDAQPLPAGGGPPARGSDPAVLQRLERALTALHANMGTGPRWSRGAIGLVRDADGKTRLFPLFDEDADDAALDALPLAAGEGHPLEEPAYRTLLRDQEWAMDQVREWSARLDRGFDAWRIVDGRLELRVGGAVTRHPCRPLATFDPDRRLWTWHVARPVGPTRAFGATHIRMEWSSALELATLACALDGAAWLFAQQAPHERTLVLAAVHRS